MGAISHSKSWVQARCGPDGLTVTLYGQAEYGDPPRTVTASIDVTDEEIVQRAGGLGDQIEELLARSHERIERHTYDEAVDAYAVLRRRG